MKGLHRFIVGLGLITSIASITTGCVVHERHYRDYPAGAAVVTTSVPSAEIVVNEPPPPPVYESVTVAPGAGYVWIPGTWVWEGRWVWSAGHWTRPPHRHAVWVGPHYEHRGGSYVYFRGTWR